MDLNQYLKQRLAQTSKMAQQANVQRHEHQAQDVPNVIVNSETGDKEIPLTCADPPCEPKPAPVINFGALPQKKVDKRHARKLDTADLIARKRLKALERDNTIMNTHRQQAEILEQLKELKAENRKLSEMVKRGPPVEPKQGTKVPSTVAKRLRAKGKESWIPTCASPSDIDLDAEDWLEVLAKFKKSRTKERAKGKDAPPESECVTTSGDASDSKSCDE